MTCRVMAYSFIICPAIRDGPCKESDKRCPPRPIVHITKQSAIRSGAIPGKVFLAGVPPYSSNITTNAFDIHAKRDLLGSCGGGCTPGKDIPRYLKMWGRGTLKIRELVGETVSLENINEGIEMMKEGGKGRCLVKL